MRAVKTEYTVTSAHPLAASIRIAHVSDLHARPADDILGMLQEARPDIIVVTGDTYERYDNRPQYEFEHRPVKRLIINCIHYTNHFLCKFRHGEKRADTKHANRFLAKAVRIAPVYMSLGNHEQKLLDDDRRFLSQIGVCLLDNDAVTATVNGSPIHIGGMSSWEYEAFLERFAQKDGCKLLLCHHPERFEPLVLHTDIDLVLAGHTHGGQFRIGSRGRGFFVPGQGLFGRYAHGMFFGGRLIVSAGCSNTVAFPRIRNPRELVMVTMKGAS